MHSFASNSKKKYNEICYLCVYFNVNYVQWKTILITRNRSFGSFQGVVIIISYPVVSYILCSFSPYPSFLRLRLFPFCLTFYCLTVFSMLSNVTFFLILFFFSELRTITHFSFPFIFFSLFIVALTQNLFNVIIFDLKR